MIDKLIEEVKSTCHEMRLDEYNAVASPEEITEVILKEIDGRVKSEVPEENISIFLLSLSKYDRQRFKNFILKAALYKMAETI
jgi:hypothetical protein